MGIVYGQEQTYSGGINTDVKNCDMLATGCPEEKIIIDPTYGYSNPQSDMIPIVWLFVGCYGGAVIGGIAGYLIHKWFRTPQQKVYRCD